MTGPGSIPGSARPLAAIICGILLTFSGLSVAHSFARPELTSFNVKLDYCHDGDTCRFHGLAQSVRLARIDAAELNRGSPACREEARLAQLMLSYLLSEAEHIQVRPTSAKDPYDRMIAEVYADGQNASTYMLTEGYAQPYILGRATPCAATHER